MFDNDPVDGPPRRPTKPTIVKPPITVKPVLPKKPTIDIGANNVTDERQITYTGTGKMNWAFGHTGQYEHGHRVYTGRPREIGLRFNYSWGD